LSPPSISVVIPAFDRAGVLPRSVGSVLAQTVPPLEVIVVDDSSADETERVVAELGSELVRYVRLDSRSGAQAARNRGVAEARGDWIAFQDSDDEWLSDKLERQVALIEDEWTVVHGGGVAGEKTMGRRLIGEPDALAVLLRRPATLFPALLVSRAALDRIGPLDEELPSFQEWDTSIRLARFCRFVAPEDPVFVYHRSPDAISESPLAEIRGYERVIDKHRGEIPPDAWEEHIRFLSRRALESGQWDEARRVLARAARRDARLSAYGLCARLRLPPRYLGALRLR
jgi:glycosyltransferase involved in cell wall biosynthesis